MIASVCSGKLNYLPMSRMLSFYRIKLTLPSVCTARMTLMLYQADCKVCIQLAWKENLLTLARSSEVYGSVPRDIGGCSRDGRRGMMSLHGSDQC